MRENGYLPLADYGLVGDCRSAALVGRDGSIDWACFPRFDSPAAFARILDAERGGSWRIAPVGEYASEFRYLDRTAVLETEHRTAGGAVRVRDALLVGEGGDASGVLARSCEGLAGEVELESLLDARFAYGADPARIEPAGEIAAVRGDGVAFRYASTVEGVDRETRFVLRQGERAAFLLGWGDDLPRPTDGDALLERTREWWERWSEQIDFGGPYEDAVVRSAITMKLLTHAETGALVAAPTTSLPEVLGGEANWDYRYTWLRDSSIALYALLALGEEREGDAFFDWICARVGEADVENDGVRVMYDVDGGSDHAEEILDHLEGYRGSRPVRIGNEACTQIQLDVYGDVLECFSTAHAWGRSDKLELWSDYRPLADWICTHWQRPDNGIWELRGPERHFTHSKLMAGVALDRAVRVATERGLPADLDRWRANAEAIREVVLRDGWSDERGAFKQSFEDERPDAANLLVPLVGLLPGDDPRVLSNLERTIAELTEDGLVYRFRGRGLHDGEATFTLCSCWLVNALAASGRADEAVAAFDSILARATPLGLLAEEIVAATGEHLGNFPQAFAHAALVTAAVNLSRAAGVGDAPASEAARAATAHLVERVELT